jgi:hypothetical protein
MSFENTPEQAATPEVAAPVKKRGRPAGAKNKKTLAKKTKAVGRPVSNPSRLKAKLESANARVGLLRDALVRSDERYHTDMAGMQAIISYLESNLKEAWKDAASV